MTNTTYRYVARRIEDTERLARELAARCGPGAVLALDGDLGAGKTAFAQALARTLGVQAQVSSPTFTIIKEYEGRDCPFYHMDVYRLTGADASQLGLDDYFFGDGVTLVEWARLIADLLPEERLAIDIERTGDEERLFRLTPAGSAYVAWCDALKESGLIT
ncbi:tRNA (adenosine(37)-N6)-threonylcarbamoyltransferase complex ATPase subunit type 1 TsaE [Paenibacillus cymbidii]|uniref:tRNA (adenosine(37)-N6)-threonylcarbamoyltransferase complex ATPase subunit type 1 TsaE n=1 Tax=Paenibacillus cymbidii TaxID=1639034 RepID=UPI001081FA59|nr:tRNA (adenosine(37)-N6)-threonylcarbamoyltransferase complex ATPase subunit type 1 TsaE [Paenibacillus cymbidii]